MTIKEFKIQKALGTLEKKAFWTSRDVILKVPVSLSILIEAYTKEQALKEVNSLTPNELEQNLADHLSELGRKDFLEYFSNATLGRFIKATLKDVEED